MLNSAFAYIPSPDQGVWHLGPIPLRAYALCILAGIGLAIVVGQRRWKARGGDPVIVVDVATWAVPFGVIGGRVYHVITSPSAYFGHGGDPVKALYIWEGGLGIWGAVILGGVGAWIGCRRNGVKLPPYGDAIAPGILLAQALGRWGNWFNNELYGKVTDQPWGLKIYEWDSSAGHAVHNAAGHPVVAGIFQPTFLYESVWDILAAIAIVLADRRWKLGHGRVFALYVVIYSLGRGVIETLRIDEADHILGWRLNVWTSIVVFIGGLTYLIISARLRPGRETELTRSSTKAGADDSTDDSAKDSGAEEGSTEKDVAEEDGTEKAGAEKASTEKDGTKADKDVAGKVVADKDDKDGKDGTKKDAVDKEVVVEKKDAVDKEVVVEKKDAVDKEVAVDKKDADKKDPADKEVTVKDSADKDAPPKVVVAKDVSAKEGTAKAPAVKAGAVKTLPDADFKAKDASTKDLPTKDAGTKDVAAKEASIATKEAKPSTTPALSTSRPRTPAPAGGTEGKSTEGKSTEGKSEEVAVPPRAES
jgi:prolipoprotein diacylglyceryl transferase